MLIFQWGLTDTLSPPFTRFCTLNYDFARLGSLVVTNARHHGWREGLWVIIAINKDEDADLPGRRLRPGRS